jgi:hypothetical protein
MPKVKAKLTLSDEPFDIHEDEIPGLTAQGIFEHVVDEPAKPKAAAKTEGTAK